MKYKTHKNSFRPERRRFVQGLTTSGMLASLGCGPILVSLYASRVHCENTVDKCLWTMIQIAAITN